MGRAEEEEEAEEGGEAEAGAEVETAAESGEDATDATGTGVDDSATDVD
jgi:hypothetical protein